MAWISGFQITGGLLVGNAFNFDSTTVDNYSWRRSPASDISESQGYGRCNIGSGYIGEDTATSMKGILFDPQALTDGNHLLASLEVKGYEDPDYKREILLYDNRTDYGGNVIGNAFSAYLRKWSDSTHYTDVIIGRSPENGVEWRQNQVYTTAFYVNFANVIYNNHHYVLLGFIAKQTQGGAEKWRGEWVSYDYNWFFNFLGGTPEADTESPEFGKAAKKKGGYNPDHQRKGTFDDSSDTIAISSKPTVSPLNAGFLHEYIMQPTDFAHFSDALFKSYYWTQTGVSDVLNEGFEALINRKRVDYVLDCLIVPVQPPNSGIETISVGGEALEWVDPSTGNVYNVTGVAVSDPFVDFSCGSITIPEYWANFLDFSGTRFKLFLPYVGFVDIQPEYINGGQLKVDYRFNCFDGSFMCFVRSTSGHSELVDSLIGQYAGVAAIHIPLTGQDYSQKISGLISAIGAVGMGIAGNGAASAVAAGGLSSLANTMIQKPGTSHANGYNASSSYLSHRTPYLIIERQSSQFSEKYPSEVGLPYYAMETIKNCRGLVVASKAHLDTVPCTTEGKERIAELLAGGIIV